jgi:hypothetical protein
MADASDFTGGTSWAPVSTVEGDAAMLVTLTRLNTDSIAATERKRAF